MFVSDLHTETGPHGYAIDMLVNVFDQVLLHFSFVTVSTGEIWFFSVENSLSYLCAGIMEHIGGIFVNVHKNENKQHRKNDQQF